MPDLHISSKLIIGRNYNFETIFTSIAAVIVLVIASASAIVTPSIIPDTEAFVATPWNVGTPMQSGDVYKYYMCDRSVQGTIWGHSVSDSDGCQNISLTFYGPFADSNTAYWLIQVQGTHPDDTAKTANAMLTVRLSTADVESVFHYKALADMIEKNLFYTSEYDRTNLNVGTTWKARSLPDMVVYSHSENVYFAGYRDSDGRTNGMSFSPLFPLPLSAVMPDHGFSFHVITE